MQYVEDQAMGLDVMERKFVMYVIYTILDTESMLKYVIPLNRMMRMNTVLENLPVYWPWFITGTGI